jgi:membrane-associated protease RseP (regulator of RpoE activity)
VNISGIDSVNGISLDNPTYDNFIDLSSEKDYNRILVGEEEFLVTKDSLVSQEKNVGTGYLILYDNSPAINSGMKISEAIIEVDGEKVHNWDELGEKILVLSPGDKIEITTTEENYEIVLGKNPFDPEKPWLGIGYSSSEKKGVFGKVANWISSFKKQNIYYEQKFEGAEFIYDFFWWIVLISFSVALVNMLPMGIFDGGRFFYLTIFAFTKSKRKAEFWFKWITKFLLFLLLILMVFWVVGIAAK